MKRIKPNREKYKVEQRRHNKLTHKKSVTI